MAPIKLFSRLSAAGVALILALAATPAWSFETKAKQAILIDFETGAVLFEKNADEIMFPASMTKIMTAYLVFEALRDERLSMDDTITISEKAWRTGGSRMFIEVGKNVLVSDIVRGIIVQSGNDASVAIAEALSGSEAAFAELMTETAREMGMEDTVFRDATGLPNPEHVTTARDLATLAKHIIADFPELYPIFSEKTFTYNEIRQGNRNPLLYKEIGVDGLKTGFIDAAGYGLTASVKRGDRRLIMVVNGLESVRDRGDQAEKLIAWGLREFENYPLFKAGEVIEDADIWLGDANDVALILDEDLTVTLPRKARKKMKVAVTYDGPIPAPITKGTQIASLVITGPEITPIQRPLYADADVGSLNFFGRIGGALSYLVFGGSSN
ncbi:MAG: D-alanyl-D-alanine carboxypeptidase family protein [Alphaproteobacteria bacterium]